jgi:uncharacterized protein (TIGR02611 family)
VDTSLLPPSTEHSDANESPDALWSSVRFLRFLRRLIIFMLGMGVLMIGVVMIVTPGPAFLIIPLGLAILASEFVWARRLLQRVKDRLQRRPGNSPPPA